MDIIESTRLFEKWLATQTPLVRADLLIKHREMCTDPFVFLRATFYRWAQLFMEHMTDEVKNAPPVIGVADLHVENFGSWRDGEGRLIWGINDDDEKALIPFTNCLARLGTSSKFAIMVGLLGISKTEALDAMDKGYRDGMKDGIVPFVLAEDNLELGRMVTSRLRSASAFWQHMQSQLTATSAVPASALAALKNSLPGDDLSLRLFRRRAGKGSLGRQRYVALAQFEGGLIAREAKARTISAWYWAAHPKTKKIEDFAKREISIGDPSAQETGGWSLRRLAPDCSKIDLASLRVNRDERLLMWAMGRETANLHLRWGADAKVISKYLRGLKRGWLNDAVKKMASLTEDDFTTWCKHKKR